MWKSAQKQRPGKRFHIYTALLKSWFIVEEELQESRRGARSAPRSPRRHYLPQPSPYGPRSPLRKLTEEAQLGQRAKGRYHRSGAASSRAGRRSPGGRSTAPRQRRLHAAQRPPASGQPGARAPPGGAVASRTRTGRACVCAGEHAQPAPADLALPQSLGAWRSVLANEERAALAG